MVVHLGISISLLLNKKCISSHFADLRNATCDATPISVEEGQNIELNCSAYGYPKVTYTWNVGEDVKHESFTTVKATPSLNGVTLTCAAKNRLGTRTCSRTVTVYCEYILLDCQQLIRQYVMHLTNHQSIFDFYGLII